MNSRRNPLRFAIAVPRRSRPPAASSCRLNGASGTAASTTEGRQLHADFNGDGFTDLAVGVPFEDQAATNDGAVNVIYGGLGGLPAPGNEVWSQGSEGITGHPRGGRPLRVQPGRGGLQR